MFLFDKTDSREIREPEEMTEEEALFDFLMTEYFQAKEDLKREMRNVPSYTAQYDSKDYYAQETEALTVATRNLLTFLKETCRD